MPIDPSAVSVLIATPHIGGVDPDWLGAFLRLAKPHTPDGQARWFRGSTARTEIAAARNLLATMLLDPGHPHMRRPTPPGELELSATHLLFWDDDVLPPPDGLMRLLAHDVDMVSGFVTTRQPPVIPAAYRLTKNKRYQSLTEFHEGLQEIDGVGCAFTLIKRRVFEAVPAPWFQFVCHADITRNMSEDIYFCRKVQAAGFRIWLDFDVQCGHIGQHVYRLEDCGIEVDEREDETA